MEELFGALFIIVVVISVIVKKVSSTRNRIYRMTSTPSRTQKRATTSSSGKTYIDNRGYRRFRNSDDLVHRWVASKKLGRKLGRNEVVHHIDHNKLNNSMDNLYVCRNAEHKRIHERDAR